MEITNRITSPLWIHRHYVVCVFREWAWRSGTSLLVNKASVAEIHRTGRCSAQSVIQNVARWCSTNAPVKVAEKDVTVDGSLLESNHHESSDKDICYKSGVPARIKKEDSTDIDIFECSVPKTQSSSNDVLFETNSEDISDVAPYLMPTFNFAAYVNKSPTLQKLVELGTNLHKLEKKEAIAQFILKLDFEKDMAPYLRFLHNIGVPPDKLGQFLTRNPLIFKEDLDNLQTRVNYLLSKKFTPQMVTSVIQGNPYWLMFSTHRIDARLGFFQKSFELSGLEVRKLTTQLPRLITYNLEHIKVSTFGFKEEMGFDAKEVKCILLEKPKLWMMSSQTLLERFNFVHIEMKVTHGQIAEQPEVLGSRLYRTMQRHKFLVHLNRAQYNPKLPGYVSLEKLVSGSDAEFCTDIAKSSVQTFNLFLKTL